MKLVVARCAPCLWFFAISLSTSTIGRASVRSSNCPRATCHRHRPETGPAFGQRDDPRHHVGPRDPLVDVTVSTSPCLAYTPSFQLLIGQSATVTASFVPKTSSIPSANEPRVPKPSPSTAGTSIELERSLAGTTATSATERWSRAGCRSGPARGWPAVPGERAVAPSYCLPARTRHDGSSVSAEEAYVEDLASSKRAAAASPSASRP